jgi:hypothetical protein
MQDVDRPNHIQALSEPARARRPRVEAKSLRVVPCSEGLNRIGRHRCWRRDIRQQPAIGAPEPQRAVGLSIYLVTLLVHRTMMSAT